MPFGNGFYYKKLCRSLLHKWKCHKGIASKHFGVSLMKKLIKVIFVTGKIKFIRIKSAQNVPMIEKHFLLYHDLEADKEIKLIRENTM